jgi:hypothetical protein
MYELKIYPLKIIIFISIVILIGWILFIKSSIDINNYITSLLSLCALVVSFHAHKHTKEQFRLNLFDKRFEIYENLLKFCSFAQYRGDIYSRNMTPEEFRQMGFFADSSFRGFGYHKSKAFFGPDIDIQLDKLNKLYSYLVVTPPHGDNATEYYEKFSEIMKIVNELPDIFRSYIYFGDHKILI